MYQLALLQLAAGDTGGYASTCGELIDHFAQEEIGSASYLAAWAIVLAPGVRDDYAPVVELAQRWRDGSLVQPSLRITLGAALMRSGRNAEAIEELMEGARLRASEEDPNASPPAYAWYLLAIANSQMGNQDAARQWHEKAQHWTREQIEMQSPRVTRWNRQLTLELMEKESATLLECAAEPIPRSG
jgi:predicted Zn-dependent protease